MDLIKLIKQCSLKHRTIRIEGLCYGKVCYYQGIRDLNECIMFDEKYKIVREVINSDNVYYYDLFSNEKYHDLDNKCITFGSALFESEDTIDVFLDPHEVFLGRIKYLKLLDIYFKELSEDLDENDKLKDKNFGKVLKFSKK